MSNYSASYNPSASTYDPNAMRRGSQKFFETCDLGQIIHDFYLDNDQGGSTAPTLSIDDIQRLCCAKNNSGYIDYTDVKDNVQRILNEDKIIAFTRKEGGSLWDFGSSFTKSYITPEAVFHAVNQRNLNPVQLAEAEKILSKVGKSLNVTIPPAAVPTPDEMLKIMIRTMIDRAMFEKPRLTYLTFIDEMRHAGFSISMTEKEFKAYLETF